jgi:hypothetical protein
LGAEDGFQTGVGSAPMGRSERGATGGAGGGGSAYLHEYKGSRYMYISNCRSDADQKKMRKTLSIQTTKKRNYILYIHEEGIGNKGRVQGGYRQQKQ